MHPTVDIFCLTHNQLPITQGFVKHLLANTENFNLTFIDNASTDGTIEFITQGATEGKWKVVLNEENLGIVKARNQSLNHLFSDFLMHIDNDQYVQPGWLDALFAEIEKGFDIVGPEAWYTLPPTTPGQLVSGQGTYSRAYFPVKRCQKPGDKYTYVGCGGMLIRKSVVDKIGLFDERFSPAYFEDPDFCFKSIQAGFKIKWVPECKVTHLANQTTNKQSLFNKNAQFMKSLIAFQKKWLPYYPGPFSS